MYGINTFFVYILQLTGQTVCTCLRVQLSFTQRCTLQISLCYLQPFLYVYHIRICVRSEKYGPQASEESYN